MLEITNGESANRAELSAFRFYCCRIIGGGPMSFKKVFSVTTAGLLIAMALPVTAGALGPKISPSSNFVVGAGTSSAVISASRGSFLPVPASSGGITGATITAVTASLKITAQLGFFTPAMIGSFVDDGIGGVVSDGASVEPVSELVAVYPRQGLSKIKAVTADGKTATLTQAAIGSGSAVGIYIVAPAAALVAIIQGIGGLPYLVDLYTPVTGGLCLSPLWPNTLCGYDSNYLSFFSTLVLATASLDGSFAATGYTIKEGQPDSNIGLSILSPGTIWAKYFDPDGVEGPAPLAPWAVPSTESGAIPRACRPDDLDRQIPNAGGVDYCVVNLVALNAGQTSLYGKPFSYYALPLTWAASISASINAGDILISGNEFANNDVVTKLQVKNSKAKISGTLTPCPALNRIYTSSEVGPANGIGDFNLTISNYASGCNVPAGSSTKIQAIGSKDTQLSQIPGDPALGTNLAKKASFTLIMP